MSASFSKILFTKKPKLGHNLKPKGKNSFKNLTAKGLENNRCGKQFSAYRRDKQATSHLHCDKF